MQVSIKESKIGGIYYIQNFKLGELMKKYSEELCKGRIYAFLGEGYNYSVLPKKGDSFCQKLKQSFFFIF